jgi:hypothetical protein
LISTRFPRAINFTRRPTASYVPPCPTKCTAARNLNLRASAAHPIAHFRLRVPLCGCYRLPSTRLNRRNVSKGNFSSRSLASPIPQNDGSDRPSRIANSLPYRRSSTDGSHELDAKNPMLSHPAHIEQSRPALERVPHCIRDWGFPKLGWFLLAQTGLPLQVTDTRGCLNNTQRTTLYRGAIYPPRNA